MLPLRCSRGRGMEGEEVNIKEIVRYLVHGPEWYATPKDFDGPSEPLRDYLAEARAGYVQVVGQATASTATTTATYHDWNTVIVQPGIVTLGQAYYQRYVKPHAHTYAGKTRMLGAHCQRCRA